MGLDRERNPGAHEGGGAGLVVRGISLRANVVRETLMGTPPVEAQTQIRADRLADLDMILHEARECRDRPGRLVPQVHGRLRFPPVREVHLGEIGPVPLEGAAEGDGVSATEARRGLEVGDVARRGIAHDLPGPALEAGAPVVGAVPGFVVVVPSDPSQLDAPDRGLHDPGQEEVFLPAEAGEEVGLREGDAVASAVLHRQRARPHRLPVRTGDERPGRVVPVARRDAHRHRRESRRRTRLPGHLSGDRVVLHPADAAVAHDVGRDSRYGLGSGGSR